MNPMKIDCEGVDWIELAQDRIQCPAFVNMVMNFHAS
jgi:hypothetical protein